MAMIPSTFAGLITTNTGWNGSQFPQMANGIAIGLTTYLTSNPSNIIVSEDSGAPGVGVGSGLLLAPTASPSTLVGLLDGNLQGHGINGPQISQLSSGLAIATCAYLATAQTVTAHSTVGAGTGLGSFVGIEPVGLGSAITSATGFNGPQWAQIVSSISMALVTFLTTNVKFTIAISGPAGPGAATGVGFGRVL